MRTYQQLTQEERYQIYAFRKANFNQSQIAQELGVHKSTVSREIKRNSGLRGYRPKQAHTKALYRRSRAPKAKKWNDDLQHMVEQMLNNQFSPEQISGVLYLEHNISLSHQAIYDYVLQDQHQGGYLYMHLRQSRKKRKKRYGSKDHRGRIKNRLGIEHRPQIVDDRSRLGDWEIDTIIGKGHQGALITIVERMSRYTLIGHVPTKHADDVANSVIRLMKPIKDKVLTITADNGREFAHHETISTALNAQVYFARPYHSWERGTNENTNGLIRQYFPKSSNFRNLSENQIQFVEERLNNRPRKKLGYLRPHNVFMKEQIQNRY